MTPDDLIALARAGATPLDIAARAYVESPTAAFVDRPDEGARLVGEIARRLAVPVDGIRVSGSAQLGFSLMHGKPFVHGKSDLDIAIVDPALAARFRHTVRAATDDLRRVDAFRPAHFAGHRTATQVRDAYIAFESEGLIRPDLMPDCAAKRDFLALFADLSATHASRYAEITGLVYASPPIFLHKQSLRIARYLASVGVATAPVPRAPVATPRSLPADVPALVGTDDATWHADALASVRRLLAASAAYVDVDCALVTPLGGTAFDVVVYYRRREDGTGNPLDGLFKVGGEFGRDGVAARYVPADRGVATLVKLTTAMVAANQRELGNRATESAFVIVLGS